MPDYKWNAISRLFPNVTYRQIDYWIRTELITLKHPQTGSGFPRLFTFHEVMRLRVLDRAISQIGVPFGGATSQSKGPSHHMPSEWIRYIWKAPHNEPILYLFQVDRQWFATLAPPKQVVCFVMVSLMWEAEWYTTQEPESMFDQPKYSLAGAS